jgi:hypothetical protein
MYAVFEYGFGRIAVYVRGGACRPRWSIGHRRLQRRGTDAVRPVYAAIVVGGGGLDGSNRDRYRSRGKTKMPPKLMPSKPIGVMWCRIFESISRF